MKLYGALKERRVSQAELPLLLPDQSQKFKGTFVRTATSGMRNTGMPKDVSSNSCVQAIARHVVLRAATYHCRGKTQNINLPYAKIRR